MTKIEEKNLKRLIKLMNEEIINEESIILDIVNNYSIIFKEVYSHNYQLQEMITRLKVLNTLIL